MRNSLHSLSLLLILLGAAQAARADIWLLDTNYNLNCGVESTFQQLAVQKIKSGFSPNDLLFVVRGNSISAVYEGVSGLKQDFSSGPSLPQSDQLRWLGSEAPDHGNVHWLSAADQEDSSPGTLAALSGPASSGREVNIYLPNTESLPSTGMAGDGVRFHELACRETVSEKDREILDTIVRIASERLGVPPSSISGTTDFKDLGADRMAIFEINATVVDELGVASFSKGKDLQKSSVYELLAMVKPVYGVTTRVFGPKPKFKVTEQKVYYATNRQFSGDSSDIEDRYTGERSADLELDYGVAVVTIPPGHKKGGVEGPLFGLKMLSDPESHIILRSLDGLDESDFFSAVGETLAVKTGGDWDGHAVIFVHGFNVPFQEAVVRTAQIAFDISFTGAPVLFSWPSDGSLFGYTSDREDATWSIGYFQSFLDKTLSELEGKKVHLIAHSMGNQVLIGALQQMMVADPGRENLFESITLAAPDFDAELFAQQIAPRVRDITNQWTIYTSDKDAALDVSLGVNSNRRLGQPVTPLAGFDVIDATGVEVTPWSVPEFHSYYATKQVVIDDIKRAIQGKSASDRQLRAKKKGGVVYYSLER